MPDAAKTRPETSEGQGSGPDLALLPPGAPLPGLTPVQRELRRRVLDGVSAPSTKLAYGHALDHLFRFLAGRPLGRALLGEWRASMDGLAPSTINVRLSAVRKLVAEARASGLLGVDEAARLTDVPNIRQQGTRLGNWLTRDRPKSCWPFPIVPPSRANATTRSWHCWSAVRCAGRSSPRSTSGCGRGDG